MATLRVADGHRQTIRRHATPKHRTFRRIRAGDWSKPTRRIATLNHRKIAHSVNGRIIQRLRTNNAGKSTSRCNEQNCEETVIFHS